MRDGRRATLSRLRAAVALAPGGLLVALLVLLVATARPAQAQLCLWNAMCAAGERCVDFQCRSPDPVRCNMDSECPAIEHCRQGICVPDPNLGPACVTAADCPGPARCVGEPGASLCRPVACLVDTDCPGIALCDQLNRCAPVECRSDLQCAGDAYCAVGNRCTPRCTEPGRIFVQSLTIPRCTACVRPDAQRVANVMDCALDYTYAEGYCIPRCDLQLPPELRDYIDLRPDGFWPGDQPFPGPPGPPIGRTPWRP